jgi:hypothetical protein
MSGHAPGHLIRARISFSRVRFLKKRQFAGGRSLDSLARLRGDVLR